MMDFLRPTGLPIHVLLTKSDKLARTEALATLASVRGALALLSPLYTAQLFSSLKRQGIDAAEAVFATWLSIEVPVPSKPGANITLAENSNASGRIRRRTDGIWKPKKKNPRAKGE